MQRYSPKFRQKKIIVDCTFNNTQSSQKTLCLPKQHQFSVYLVYMVQYTWQVGFSKNLGDDFSSTCLCCWSLTPVWYSCLLFNDALGFMLSKSLMFLVWHFLSSCCHWNLSLFFKKNVWKTKRMIMIFLLLTR